MSHGSHKSSRSRSPSYTSTESEDSRSDSEEEETRERAPEEETRLARPQETGHDHELNEKVKTDTANVMALLGTKARVAKGYAVVPHSNEPPSNFFHIVL